MRKRTTYSFETQNGTKIQITEDVNDLQYEDEKVSGFDIWSFLGKSNLLHWALSIFTNDILKK